MQRIDEVLKEATTLPERGKTEGNMTWAKDNLRQPPDSVGPVDWDEVAPDFRRELSQAMNANRWPIYLFGGAGRGKSCAAACIYCRAPGRPLWVETNWYIGKITRCRMGCPDEVSSITSSSTESEPSLVGKVRNASLVVFDDVGIRIPTEAAFEILFELVSVRKGKPTIYTSNLGGGALADLFDDRIASRLLSGTVIEVHGKDRRLKGTHVVKVNS
jgi:DNA replication protein DnaC